MGKDNFIEIWTEPLGDVIPKLYVIYLLIAVCVTLVRNIRLALQLWSFQPKQASLSGDRADNVEVIAEAALKRKIERVFKLSGSSDTINKPTLLFKVDSIEARFLYLWETCYAKVQATKALAAMTIILSVCLAFLGFIGILGAPMGKTDRVFVLAYLRDLSWLLCPGFFISAFLYASAFWFQGALARRRTDWNYAKARFREECCNGTTGERRADDV